MPTYLFGNFSSAIKVIQREGPFLLIGPCHRHSALELLWKKFKKIFFITVTSHECHSISNHLQPNYKLTKQCSALLAPCEGNPSVTDGKTYIVSFIFYLFNKHFQIWCTSCSLLKIHGSWYQEILSWFWPVAAGTMETPKATRSAYIQVYITNDCYVIFCLSGVTSETTSQGWF